MKTPRRGLAALAVGALAAASIVFLGTGAANALPSGITNPVGTVTPTTSGSTLTLTQTTDVAVVNFTALTLLAGETLDIVQDPGDILIIRNTGVIPAGFEGTLTADATVIISSPLGIGVNTTGSLTAGEDLILTTGAITDAAAVLPAIEIDPSATDGLLATAPSSSVTAGGYVGVVGDSVLLQGFIDALTGYAMLYSIDRTAYDPTGVWRLIWGGDGLPGGGVSNTGSVFANGGVFVYAGAPGGMSIEGTIVSNGQGEFGFAQDIFFGQGESDGLVAQAYSNIDDPVGALFPSSAMTGTTIPTFWSAVVVTADGDTAPTSSEFGATDLALGDEEGYTFPLIQATCYVDEDGLRETMVALPGGAQIVGTPLTPVGYDFNVPNQPPIPVGDVAFISFNEQVHTTVGGWDVLTVTAVHLVGEEGLDLRVGVVSCAVPAASVLASTGSTMDASQATLAAALSLLGGAVLVLRRRRATV